jgi:hypothetical protein
MAHYPPQKELKLHRNKIDVTDRLQRMYENASQNKNLLTDEMAAVSGEERLAQMPVHHHLIEQGLSIEQYLEN